MRNLTASLALAAALLAAAPSHARPADAGTAKKILKDSVAFPTVAGCGQVPALAAYYADVLKAAGFADAELVIPPKGASGPPDVKMKGDGEETRVRLTVHMDCGRRRPRA